MVDEEHDEVGPGEVIVPTTGRRHATWWLTWWKAWRCTRWSCTPTSAPNRSSSGMNRDSRQSNVRVLAAGPRRSMEVPGTPPGADPTGSAVVPGEVVDSMLSRDR